MDPSTPSSSVPRDKLLKREDQDLDLEWVYILEWELNIDDIIL